jgi:hypothetical protein
MKTRSRSSSGQTDLVKIPSNETLASVVSSDSEHDHPSKKRRVDEIVYVIVFYYCCLFDRFLIVKRWIVKILIRRLCKLRI